MKAQLLQCQKVAYRITCPDDIYCYMLNAAPALTLEELEERAHELSVLESSASPIDSALDATRSRRRRSRLVPKFLSPRSTSSTHEKFSILRSLSASNIKRALSADAPKHGKGGQEVPFKPRSDLKPPVLHPVRPQSVSLIHPRQQRRMDMYRCKSDEDAEPCVVQLPVSSKSQPSSPPLRLSQYTSSRGEASPRDLQRSPEFVYSGRSCSHRSIREEFTRTFRAKYEETFLMPSAASKSVPASPYGKRSHSARLSHSDPDDNPSCPGEPLKCLPSTAGQTASRDSGSLLALSYESRQSRSSSQLPSPPREAASNLRKNLSEPESMPDPAKPQFSTSSSEGSSTNPSVCTSRSASPMVVIGRDDT